jgi:site-specific recombinase XerD
MKPTTAIVTRNRVKADGTETVYLRITFNRTAKFYDTGKSMLPEDFADMINAKRPRDEMKKQLTELQKIEQKAIDIIDKMPVFTFAQFDIRFNQDENGAAATIENSFNTYIKNLRREKRIGTAVSYEATLISLEKFCTAKKIKWPITFFDVTVQFLKDYEYWMTHEKGKSVSTVGIYLRSLRSVFNVAISENIVSKDYYPFGLKKNYKYEIPASKNIKKALTLQQVQRLYNYEAAPGSVSERMLDYWLFIYFCNGLNVKDVALLKYNNLNGDFLYFKRAKTINTKRTIENVKVPLNDITKAIIKKYGNKTISNDAYIFPILQPGISAQREYEVIQQQTKLINTHMKLIAQDLEIKNKVTTYVARHTFSTVLKQSGASIEYISEALGHSDIKTTKNYLASFEDETKIATNNALANFSRTRKIKIAE